MAYKVMSGHDILPLHVALSLDGLFAECDACTAAQWAEQRLSEGVHRYQSGGLSPWADKPC